MQRRQLLKSLTSAGALSIFGIAGLISFKKVKPIKTHQFVAILDFNEPIDYETFFQKRHKIYDPDVILRVIGEFESRRQMLGRDLEISGSIAKVIYTFDSVASKDRFLREAFESQPQMLTMIRSKSQTHISIVSA